jgi:hypothetical protein
MTPAEINEALAKGSFVDSGGKGGSGSAGNYAPSGFPGAGGTGKIEITVIAPPFTDPNAVAEIVNQYLTDAIDRGTLRGLAVA